MNTTNERLPLPTLCPPPNVKSLSYSACRVYWTRRSGFGATTGAVTVGVFSWGPRVSVFGVEASAA